LSRPHTQSESTIMSTDNTDRTRSEAELYRHEGNDFVSITAAFRSDGALEVTDSGSGPCCKDFFGVSGVDAVVTVEAKHKDKLLLALLKAKFGGDNMAFSHFRELLEAEKIPFDFCFWPDFD
jgi:hypothetical protein